MVAENKWSGYVSLFIWLFFSYFILQYFFSSKSIIKSEKIVLGEKLTISPNFLARIPLIHSDPVVTNPSKKQSLLVSTNLCLYKLIEDSASMASIKYKKIKDNLDVMVGSLDMPEAESFSNFIFLPNASLELPIFKINHKSEIDDLIKVNFSTEYQGWKIDKKYTFFKDSFKFLVEFKFNKIEENPANLDSARIVFSAPIEDKSVKNSSLLGLVNDSDLNKVLKIDLNSFENTAWQTPYLFGAENRFFIHAFLGEAASGIIKRAYFSNIENSFRKNITLELWPIVDKSVSKMEFFVGPKQVNHLVAARKDLGNAATLGFFGWFYKIILDLLERLFLIFGNYGISLIVLAFLLRLLFFPLVFFAKKKTVFFEQFEQDHANEIAEINRKFANDFTLKSENLNKFYSRYGVSQFGKMTSLIPVGLQILLIFGLYRVLANYISLFNAPFILWITDLSTKDPYFVFPFMIGLVQFFHQKLIVSGQNKDLMAGFQGMLLKYLSPILMVAFFSTFPSGATLFWLFNNIFASIEEIILKNIFSLKKRF